MTLTEPMTTLTDYALGLVVVILAVRLVRAALVHGQAAIWLWAAGFFAAAVAAVIGGTAHGFQEILAAPLHAVVWRSSMLAIGLSALLLSAAALHAAVAASLRRWLLAAIALQFAVFAIWMFSHSDFIYAIYDYGVSMALVLCLAVYGWVRRSEPSGPWIVAGLLVAVVAAVIQQGGLVLHESFNQNDLYHVVQALSFYLLYRGGLLLRDQ